MKFYHSSTVIVHSPNILFSRDFLDFGRGFYMTTIYDQALKYAQRFIRRQKDAFLNVYELSDDLDNWNVKVFDAYDDEWLDFVSACRSGLRVENYDLVIGGIANDKVIMTLDLYFSGTLNREETLGRLKYEKSNIQYCIRSQKMLDNCLTFISSEKL